MWSRLKKYRPMTGFGTFSVVIRRCCMAYNHILENENLVIKVNSNLQSNIRKHLKSSVCSCQLYHKWAKWTNVKQFYPPISAASLSSVTKGNNIILTNIIDGKVPSCINYAYHIFVRDTLYLGIILQNLFWETQASCF